MVEFTNMNVNLESKINGTKTNIEHLSAYLKKLFEENKNITQFEEHLNVLKTTLTQLCKKQEIISKLVGIFNLEKQELEWMMENDKITFCDADLIRYCKIIKENQKIIAELEINLIR